MQRPFPAQGSFRHSSSSTTRQGRRLAVTSGSCLQPPASPEVQQVGRASAELPENLPPTARRTEQAVEAQKAEQSNHQLPTYQCSGAGWGPRCNQGGTSSCVPLGSEHKHQLRRKGVRRHSH